PRLRAPVDRDFHRVVDTTRGHEGRRYVQGILCKLSWYSRRNGGGVKLGHAGSHRVYPIHTSSDVVEWIPSRKKQYEAARLVTHGCTVPRSNCDGGSMRYRAVKREKVRMGSVPSSKLGDALGSGDPNVAGAVGRNVGCGGESVSRKI